MKPKGKYEDIYVIKGEIEVEMATKKGDSLGTTKLLLRDVWIKIPIERR